MEFEKNYVGNKNYFTIIGHTPVATQEGYEYYKDDNALNIDGGCVGYLKKIFSYDHTPLVEIDSKNNRLIILTFNNNNEIVHGNYFENKKSFEMSNTDFNNYKKYIDRNVKTRKL